RRKLMDNIIYLRAEMTKAGLETLGDPSPIVPVRIGTEAMGRFASRHLAAMGGIANLVEYPAVPQGGARFRFQVMASHTPEDIDEVVEVLASAMRKADLEYRLGHEGEQAELARARLPQPSPA
ncbi:MAG: aminotransferase class I/II-fold pyridoxal phosphate-dependent enzyme, partial [Cypionkella sp.]